MDSIWDESNWNGIRSDEKRYSEVPESHKEGINQVAVADGCTLVWELAEAQPPFN